MAVSLSLCILSFVIFEFEIDVFSASIELEGREVCFDFFIIEEFNYDNYLVPATANHQSFQRKSKTKIQRNLLSIS
jgi:hypothetical protein